MRLLGTALLATTTLVVVPGIATAAGETCQGKPATIVGKNGPVIGTEGDDVIVAGREAEVKALGGNDLICLTGPVWRTNSYWVADIDAGPGDDVVNTTGAVSASADVILGAGADTYLGGNHQSYVTPGTARDYTNDVPGADVDKDVVRIAASVVSGMPGQPNPDVIEDVDDVTWRGSESTSGVPVTSGGTGSLALELPGADLLVDNAQGRATLGGKAVVTWSGFSRFYVSPPAPGHTFSFVGGDADEQLLLFSKTPIGRLDIHLGGGSDYLNSSAPGATGSVYDGGDGDESDDHVAIGSSTEDLAFDLQRERFSIGGDGSLDGLLRGFESVHGSARLVSIIGNQEDNQLSATACTSVLQGKDGADYLTRSSDFEWEYFTFKDCKIRVKAWGGDGRDRLRGFGGPDRLYGGRGKDIAEGRGGRDSCRAEVEKKCER